jgi:hypothetical protein
MYFSTALTVFIIFTKQSNSNELNLHYSARDLLDFQSFGSPCILNLKEFSTEHGTNNNNLLTQIISSQSGLTTHTIYDSSLYFPELSRIQSKPTETPCVLNIIVGLAFKKFHGKWLFDYMNANTGTGVGCLRQSIYLILPNMGHVGYVTPLIKTLPVKVFFIMHPNIPIHPVLSQDPSNYPPIYFLCVFCKRNWFHRIESLPMNIITIDNFLPADSFPQGYFVMNIFKESTNPYPFGCEKIFWKLLYRRYEVADINEHELCKSTDAFIDILVSNVDPNLTINAGSDLDPSVLR